MKTFEGWLEEKGHKLPVYDENIRRSGIRQNYPDAYVRAQYPHKYFNPYTPDADYYLSDKAKPRKDKKVEIPEE